MKRLYWVRHGESFVNLTKEFSHRLVDKPLTPKGMLQAEQTADYFADRQISAVYCSPLMRAVQTAEIIARRLALAPTVVENFREMNVGDLEKQRPSAETWAINGRIFTAWLDGDRSLTYPNGEDGHMLVSRIRSGLELIASATEHANLIVVGHGGSFMASVRDLCPEIDLGWLKHQSVENCSITEILLDRANGNLIGKLIRWSDYSHLHDEAANLVSGVPEKNELGGR